MANPAKSKKPVGIVSKPSKPEVAQIMPGLIDWMRGHGHDLLVDPETSPHAPGIAVVSREEMGKRDLQFVIVLGGDGTVLFAGLDVPRSRIPIILVNLETLA